MNDIVTAVAALCDLLLRGPPPGAVVRVYILPNVTAFHTSIQSNGGEPCGKSIKSE